MEDDEGLAQRSKCMSLTVERRIQEILQLGQGTSLTASVHRNEFFGISAGKAYVLQEAPKREGFTVYFSILNDHGKSVSVPYTCFRETGWR